MAPYRYFKGKATTALPDDLLDDDMASPAASEGVRHEDEEEEDDFMSDKFLEVASKAQSKEPKSYGQMRKEALKRSEERGRTKSRAEREREAREEGLRKSLLASTEQDAPTAGPSSKALDMMKKMGFKPGQALGKQYAQDVPSAQEKEQPPSEEEDGFISLTAGIGSKKRSAAQATLGDSKDPATKDHRRVDPIEIQMRQGRSGIGVEEGKRRRLANLVDVSERTDKLTVDDYRTRSRENHQERRAEGQLKNARKTCFELDSRIGVKSNYLWLDPLEEYHRQRELAIGGSRFGPKGRLGDFGAVDEADEEAFGVGDDQSKPSDTGEIVVELEDEAFEDGDIIKRDEEMDDFLKQDAMTRLGRTLRYLRDKHHYCFWCGAQYDSAQDLEDSCPGEEEEDH